MVSAVSDQGGAHAANRAEVLDAIRAAGRISRVDLGRERGLNGATVSMVVRSLIRDGLVVESGKAESTGGKPAVLLSIALDARYAVGINLDHAGISYVIANLGGAVVGRWRRQGAGADHPERVVARIAAELDMLVEQVGIDRDKLLGVGVVSPGPITGSDGMALTPPVMQEWRDFPLSEALHAATDLPVLVENDATAAAVGEYWAGTVGATGCFAAVYMGTGLGAGIVIDGVVYRGTSGNTGEIGHICVDIDGPTCWCGNHGCVEALAGPSAVLAEAERLGLQLPGLGVVEDFAALARAALQGDAIALRLIDRSARYIAVATQTLANILDVELVVLTGPAFTMAASLYVPAIRERLDGSFFARAAHPVEVMISPNAAEAAAIGGAALVLQTELAPKSVPSAAGGRRLVRGASRQYQRVGATGR